MDLPQAKNKFIILNKKVFFKYPVLNKIFIKNGLKKILLENFRNILFTFPTTEFCSWRYNEVLKKYLNNKKHNNGAEDA